MPAYPQLKVLEPIVVTHTVAVVNNLILVKTTTEMLLHYELVLSGVTLLTMWIGYEHVPIPTWSFVLPVGVVLTALQASMAGLGPTTAQVCVTNGSLVATRALA